MNSPIVHFIWGWTGNVLMLIVGIWALWRGGRTERWGAAIMAIGWVVTPLVQTHRFNGIDPGIFTVDLLVFLALTALSLWSRRLWTLFAAAFMLDDVASHFAFGMASHIGGWAYITALGIWGGYGIIFALAAGMRTVERQRSQAALSST